MSKEAETIGFIDGRDLGRVLLDALGIDKKNVTKIVLIADRSDMAKVEVTHLVEVPFETTSMTNKEYRTHTPQLVEQLSKYQLVSKNE